MIQEVHMLVAMPGAPLVASLLLVAMPFVASSFLLLVVRPGAPSSVVAPNIKEVTELHGHQEVLTDISSDQFCVP